MESPEARLAGHTAGGSGGACRISSSPGQAVPACASTAVQLSSIWCDTQLLINVPDNLVSYMFVRGLIPRNGERASLSSLMDSLANKVNLIAVVELC